MPGKAFAISEQVYAAAGLEMPSDGRITLSSRGTAISATLSDVAPVPPASWLPLGEPRAAFQRMWGG
jgi:hypothetical protein